MQYEHIKQPFEPVFDAESRVLILGSLPSAASRKNGFYYGNPHNRMWRVLSAVFDEPVPETADEKRSLLLRHHTAMWDVIEECDITGSSDASIRNAVPADIRRITDNADIEMVFLNGQTAGRLYKKYMDTGRGFTVMPSTSPANASVSLERLISEWKVIRMEE